MKMRPVLGACAALLLIFSATASHATTITFTIDDLNTLAVSGYSSDTVTLVSPGDWDVSFTGSLEIYSGTHIEFASPDYGSAGSVVYFTNGPTGNSLNIQVTDTAPKTTLDYCGDSSPIPDGSTCGIGYTFPSYATAYGTVEEVPSAPATPEPSSLSLLGTGLLGVAGAARRRFV